jgi:hypothetical protein
MAGNSSQNENTFLQKNLIGLLLYDPLHGGRDESILSAIQENRTQNPAIREIFAKYYRIMPQNRAKLAPSLFQNYYYEFPYTWIFQY